MGIYIAPLKYRSAILETISVPIQNTNAEKVPFRVHVYELDSIGGVGDDLLPENIYGILQKYDCETVELDILKYQLKIPVAQQDAIAIIRSVVSGLQPEIIGGVLQGANFDRLSYQPLAMFFQPFRLGCK